MSDKWVRWKLYVYSNRRHDGEIWLAAQRQSAEPYLRMFLVEQNDCPSDAEVLGEVRTRLIDGAFVHDIIPLQKRSDAELQRMRQQAEEHKKYRAELYKTYPIEKR